LPGSDGWRLFFDRYWRLVYNVARQAGLVDAEAQEVVQQTFIYLSRRMATFQYDPGRGSFKSWLRVVTRSRIQVHLRTRKGEKLVNQPFLDDGSPEADSMANYPDPAGTRWMRFGSASGRRT